MKAFLSARHHYCDAWPKVIDEMTADGEREPEGGPSSRELARILRESQASPLVAGTSKRERTELISIPELVRKAYPEGPRPLSGKVRTRRDDRRRAIDALEDALDHFVRDLPW
jgi:hypothetical protein